LHLDGICSIVGCDAPIVLGKKSYNDPQHAEIERLHFERDRAAFTLHQQFDILIVPFLGFLAWQR
jgi:hypothetical protein